MRRLAMAGPGWLALAMVVLSARAGAQAAPDTGLARHLAGLRDSSTAYFGQQAIEFDTAGVDSLARLYLQHPELAPRVRSGDLDDRRVLSENAPIFRINPSEGFYGGSRVQLGGTGRGPGAFSVSAGRAWRLKEGRYAAGWTRSFGDRRSAFSLGGSVYRSTDGLESGEVLPTPRIRGPVLGEPEVELRYRREGWNLRARVQHNPAALSAEYRDEQSHDMNYSDSLVPRFTGGDQASLRAVPGTARMISLTGALGASATDGMLRARLGRAGFGGNFEFTSVQAHAARMVRVGSLALLAVQAGWSAADTGAPAQYRFQAGRHGSLLGYPTAAAFGRQLWQGKATLLLGPDILRMLRVPHPAWLPLSLALGAEAVAVPALRPDQGLTPVWPGAAGWASDVTVGLWYRPGLPDPLDYVKLDVALPTGPVPDDKAQVRLSYHRLLDWF